MGVQNFFLLNNILLKNKIKNNSNKYTQQNRFNNKFFLKLLLFKASISLFKIYFQFHFSLELLLVMEL